MLDFLPDWTTLAGATGGYAAFRGLEVAGRVALKGYRTAKDEHRQDATAAAVLDRNARSTEREAWQKLVGEYVALLELQKATITDMNGRMDGIGRRLDACEARHARRDQRDADIRHEMETLRQVVGNLKATIPQPDPTTDPT